MTSSASRSMPTDHCREHADPEAIGIASTRLALPRAGTTPSGANANTTATEAKSRTVSTVSRSRLAHSEDFHCLLDARLYLPEEWADGPDAPKKNYIPDEVTFKTKPQIALDLIDRAVSQWDRECRPGHSMKTDARDGKFLDGLDERDEAFVGEIPPNFHAWHLQTQGTAKTNQRPLPDGPPRGVRIGNLVVPSRAKSKTCASTHQHSLLRRLNSTESRTPREAPKSGRFAGTLVGERRMARVSLVVNAR